MEKFTWGEKFLIARAMRGRCTIIEFIADGLLKGDFYSLHRFIATA